MPIETGDIRDFRRVAAKRGYAVREGVVEIKIRFSKELFDQIKAEADARDWPIARMVRHLCEASIEGIE